MSLEHPIGTAPFQVLNNLRWRNSWVKFQEQVDMILYNFHGMNSIAVLLADIINDQLAILFNLPFIEDLVSILWHQHDVVGNLAIAMAETA